MQALDEAPDHMKRKSNAEKPIELQDTDGEDEEPEAGPSRRKRRLKAYESSDVEVPSTPPIHPKSSRSPGLFDVADPHFEAVVPQPTNEAGPSETKSSEPDVGNLLLQVLDILPDVCPEYALKHLTVEVQAGRTDRAVEEFVEMALEMSTNTGYPKAGDSKAKGKDKAEVIEEGTYEDPRYRFAHRIGRAYHSNSMAALEGYFNRISLPQSASF